MSWWRDEMSMVKGGLGKWCLGLTIVFFVPILYFRYDTQSIWFQLSMFAANASLSVVITLFIVEKALASERNRQMQNERIHTYGAIMDSIIYIAYEAIYRTSVWNNPDERHIRIDLISMMKRGNTETSKAIRKIANKIYTDIIEEREILIKNKRELEENGEFGRKWKDNIKLDNHIAKQHFEIVDRRLSEMRSILIPRALVLIDSPELRCAMHAFEDKIRGYEIIRISRPDDVNTKNLEDFLLASADAYEAIDAEAQKETPLNNDDC